MTIGYYVRLFHSVAPTIALGGLLLLLGSCTPGNSGNLVTPPPTPPLSRNAVAYALVQTAYVNVLDTPENTGVSVAYFRQGTILKVLERRMVKNNDTPVSWVLVQEGNSKKGWVLESALRVYDTEEQAKTAAQRSPS